MTKVYVVEEWNEHEGLFYQHEPIAYFFDEEDAQNHLETKLAEYIQAGYILDNNVWYEQNIPYVDAPDDVYLRINTIEVH